MELGEIIGEGQFGNVHKGSYKGRDGQTIAVAVKTCKVDADLATAEKFLEEACMTNLYNYILFVNSKIYKRDKHT